MTVAPAGPTRTQQATDRYLLAFERGNLDKASSSDASPRSR